MKKTVLFSLMIVAFANQIFAQTIRRVNNYPGVSGTNVYTTIQQANDAASDGDIIYVEPTGQSVGSLNCTKQLTIIGNGYLLDQNPNTPFNKGSSIMGGITFDVGSSNSTLIGMDLLATGIGTGINVFSNNVTVTRCKLSGVNLLHNNLWLVPNNFTITRCLLNGSISYGYGPASGYTLATGHLIANNIFSSGGGHSVQGLYNSVIVNNTFFSKLSGTGTGPTNGIVYNVANTSVSNNIFDFRDAHANSFAYSTNDAQIYANNTLSNNISLAQSGLPSDNGNINSANQLTVFQVENPWQYDVFDRGYFDKDATYQLATNSPAKAIGTGGTDAGAFGGATPYVLSGLAPYPIITNFTTTGAGNNNVPLQVSITVRSNN